LFGIYARPLTEDSRNSHFLITGAPASRQTSNALAGDEFACDRISYRSV